MGLKLCGVMKEGVSYSTVQADIDLEFRRGKLLQLVSLNPHYNHHHGFETLQVLQQLKVSALNEDVSGSVKTIFKAWEQRLNSSELYRVYVWFKCNLNNAECSGQDLLVESLSKMGHLESNLGDPELIVFIPFTSDVKIKSISVVGGADGTSPAKMRAFINREGIDFSDAENMQPVQEWELAENLQGVLEYQTRYSKFQSVGNITLHFPDNFGGHTTQIHYIGLKGEATQLKRDVVATIVYEVMPNPSDHKTRSETGGGLSQVE
ncbi:pith domain-containing protein 1 [Phtheirospermum japonicum]|uniref:Pith domain-containing protein 1 n=1 Tax=Phtheirospermum japonicum TaxID=374723 RepID=A0A830BKU8_9LAMI|nr:pith domain-containing protein 1 [Phtheirospermum japonicum]